MTRLTFDAFDAFVYDADDTLIDNGEDPLTGSIGLHNESRLRASRRIAETLQLRTLADLPIDSHAVAFHRSPHHSSEGVFHWLLQEAGIFSEDTPFDPQHPLIATLVNEKDRIYTQMLAKEAKEIPGALSFVAGAYERGFENRQAIGSIGKYADIRQFTHSQGFSVYIPDVLIASKEDVNNLKPDPEVFLLVADWLGVPRSDARRVGVFEDNPRGMLAAKKAGNTVLAVTTIHPKSELLALPEETRPDYIAADFIEYAQMFGIS